MNGVGASATTSRGNAIAVLGTLETHTVYAAELEGVRLALRLFLRHDGQRSIESRRAATIFTDNQAAILACASAAYSWPADGAGDLVSGGSTAVHRMPCAHPLDTRTRGRSGQRASGQNGERRRECAVRGVPAHFSGLDAG